MKTSNNIFLTLVEKSMDQNRFHMRPVIEKELLHYDILFALNNAGFLDKLTFQGGTSLRLCYGAPRFSEDLDFAGGYDFDAKKFHEIKACLESYLNNRYELEVSVKEPKDLLAEPENRNIEVNKWQIRIVTHPERKDLPKQKIKIEIANIPAYTREAKQLLRNYDFLPDGYNDLIIITQTLDEIFTDKVVAFVDCQKRIRYRDIWDFYWLIQQGASIDLNLINKKIIDYKVQNYTDKLDNMLNGLFNIIQGKEFSEQMSRFLPMDVQERTLLKKDYLQLLFNEIFKMYETLGFEWNLDKNGKITCTNSLRELTSDVFQKTIITMMELKDKYGFIIAYGKKPDKLIIEPSLEEIAKEITKNPVYKVFLPNGYEINSTLKPSEWWVAFV